MSEAEHITHAKTCRRCRLDKRADAFSRPPSSKEPDGLSSWCRACQAEYHRGYRRRASAMLRKAEHLEAQAMSLRAFAQALEAKQQAQSCPECGAVPGRRCTSKHGLPSSKPHHLRGLEAHCGREGCTQCDRYFGVKR